MMAVDDLLARIAQLSERDRVRLWRRAHQMNLIPSLEATPAQQPAGPNRIPRSVPASSAGTVESERPQTTAEASPPQQRVSIVFDGGSKGNPGPGYGSYQVTWNGDADPVQRLTLGRQLTNNEAEYDTLISALAAVVRELEQHGQDPSQVTLQVRGDSQLVINQVTGRWQASEPRMRERRDAVRQLLARFGRSRVRYQPRQQSVDVLGH